MTPNFVNIVCLILALHAPLDLRLSGVSGQRTKDVCFDEINCPDVTRNLSDPEDCTKYFVCIGTSLYPRSCNHGETFHQNAYRCLSTKPSCAQTCLVETNYTDHIVYPTTTWPLEPVTTPEATTTPVQPTTLPVDLLQPTTLQVDLLTTSEEARAEATTQRQQSSSVTTPPVTMTTAVATISFASHLVTDALSDVTSQRRTDISIPVTSASDETTAATVAETTAATVAETTLSSVDTALVTETGLSGSKYSHSSSPDAESKTTTTVTTTEHSTVAMTSCPPPYPCDVGALTADADDCARYYRCVRSPSRDSRWMSQGCPPGHRFDYVRATCLPAAGAVNCHPKCPEGRIHNVTLLTSNPREGATLQFICTFRYVFAQIQVRLRRFDWYLNSVKLSPVDSDRLKIDVTEPDLTGTWSSTLTFNPATPKDSGIVRCAVEYGNNDYSYVDSMAYHVIALPSVSVDPMVASIFIGQTLTIKCRLTSESYNTSFVYWLKDGRNLTENDVDVEIKDDVGQSTLVARVVKNVVYSCQAANEAGLSGVESCTVTAVKPATPVCKADRDGGLEWTMTVVNSVAVTHCPPSFSGAASRRCVSDEDVSDEDASDEDNENSVHWLPPNLSQCTDKRVLQLVDRVSTVSQGVGVDNATFLADIANTLSDILNDEGSNVTQSTWRAAFRVVDLLSDIRRRHPTTPVHDDELRAMLSTTSRLIGGSQFLPFEIDNMTSGEFAVKVMRMIDTYSLTCARQLVPGQQMTVVVSGIVVQIYAEKASQIRSLSFPDKNSSSSLTADWLNPLQDSIYLSGEALRSKNQSDDMCYVASSYYETLGSYLPAHGADVASRVVSLAVDNCITKRQLLQPPVRITLQRRQDNVDDMLQQCAYWNYSTLPNGDWSTAGCKVVSVENSLVSCSCNHLTNFAILFSPAPAVGQHDVILSIISVIGCVISIVALIMTIVFFAVNWKQLKSHHAVVLINLCIALIIANIVFLIGSNQVNNKDWCKAIAVLLHYFFLAAFFLMLAEGVQMLLYIKFVFHARRKRETAALIFAAWFVPAAIVGISLGITQTEGYGGSTSCWLSIETGLIWAFVIPALLIICLNCVILIVVLCRIGAIKSRIEKMEKKARIRATVWNTLVILPLLGVTWVFGVMSVNEHLVAFQYIFAVANSLQGFFIFVFNALCNRKVGQKSKYSTRSTPHGRPSRPAVHDRGAEAEASDDNIIMIMADVPDPFPPSASLQNGAAADTRPLDGGYDGPGSSEPSSASSTGSHDLPNDRTSTTEMSDPLTNSFRPLAVSSSRSSRPPTVPMRPARRPLERIVSGSSC